MLERPELMYFHMQVTREYVEKAIREHGPSVLDNPAAEETTETALAKLTADPRNIHRNLSD